MKAEYMVLGVAFDWGRRKGLDVFSFLAENLDKRYQIVLVGTDDSIDAQLPKNILSIHRTHDQYELAEIYSSADVFVNPTREDNFPTVNIEALACGTPVITFETGGSPEIINDKCGSVIAVDDNEGMLAEINRVCEKKPYKREDCLLRAKELEKNECFKEYVALYA